MKTNDLYTLEKEVEEILEELEYTRKDDMRLYYEYCCRKLEQEGHCNSFDFAHLFWNKWYRQEKKIKPYKSVERTRRKVQARRPELLDTPTADARMEESMAYEKYALN